MSNEDEFVASLNRLENRIISDQTDLKRDVQLLMNDLINLQSGIDRRYGSLMEEVNSLKSSHTPLDQINNRLAVLEAQGEHSRRDLNDLPNRIRAILETFTSRLHSTNHTTTSTPELDSSQIGDKDTVESTNLGGNEFRTEERGNDCVTTVPSTSTANDDNLNESANANVNANLSSISITDGTEHELNESEQSTNETLIQKSNETTLNANNLDVCLEDEDKYHEINATEGGEVDVNGNHNKTLHEKSKGINQNFENDNQIGQQVNNDDQNESFSTINKGHTESTTLKQSNTRKRGRSGKSLAAECSSLENSSTSGEVSTPGSDTTKSKRSRVSSLNRRDSAEQLSTGSGVDLSEGDDANGGGIDSNGEGEDGDEQGEDEESWWDTEFADEDEGGHYKIEVLKLKCIEENCNAEVASRDELHRHLRNEHNTSSPYRCLAQGCFERFEKLEGHGLAVHVRVKHANISTWPCLHCTKTYKSQNRLHHHLYYYHFEGEFKCGYGGCHYDRVATLRIEISSHQHSVHPKKTLSNSTIFTCHFNNCGKTFTRKCHFNVHQRLHTGDKPFPCDWKGCGKFFALRNYLDRHQKTHLRDKPFPCDWNGCGKSFPSRYCLVVHQRNHQKVKPFKCTWNRCDYAATQCCNVIKHIRTKHFGLPDTEIKQRQLGIEDNRDPRVYVQETTHQSDNNSTDSADSDN